MVSPRLLRQLHLYVGVFFAPTILFFAASGALQVYGLHEASRDGGYTPPAVIERLSQVHIHQRYQDKPGPPAKPPGRPAEAAAPKPAPASGPPKAAPASMAARKAFFLATAIGLILSSVLGIWMALTQSRQRRLAWLLLIAGIAAPILLLVV